MSIKVLLNLLGEVEHKFQLAFIGLIKNYLAWKIVFLREVIFLQTCWIGLNCLLCSAERLTLQPWGVNFSAVGS